MSQTAILLIKFISCVIAFAIGLDVFFEATFVDILSFSLLVTVVSYMLVDRIILPQLGNRAALIIDFLLVYMSVWIFGNILLNSYMQIAWGSIISAIVITAVEVFVHLNVKDDLSSIRTEERKGNSFNPKLAFGTEFAEEEDIWDEESHKK
ncbi:YndM family protein [Bacillus sp. 165]|uniref:YndM family protein n=1 Tax=Bacillus sp. 165 TaxID=1529117 RepID=UPI001ADC11C9|nr:YndM family protein [Bacillus sp. 165]MBO9128964.1 YndM family protein [Bacillus sp. 165]